MSEPWIEKYRPKLLENIVLDKNNRTIFESIIDLKYIPNLLLYGPPGTGKTTAVLNLAHHLNKDKPNGNELVIHLNASDDRGIDTMRNQIRNFVKSKHLFVKGIKMVILDEVDYMTKSAQQALRCLIDEMPAGVRFCLICNYINRIDESIRDNFIRLRFNQLPPEDISRFLKEIVYKENIQIDDSTLEIIQKTHHSDMRSMINFIQTNYSFIHEHCVIQNSVWTTVKTEQDVATLQETYAIDMYALIKHYANYVIRQGLSTRSFLKSVEFIIHHPQASEVHMRKFFMEYIFLKN
jgi:replication factor C subunit 3/5